MNKLIIIGNLTADPQATTTPSGKVCTTFTVAVNDRNDNATFFRVSAWEKLGESCAKCLSKGRKVCVEGAVSCHAYKTHDGEARASLDVTARNVEFLSAPQRDETASAQPDAGFTPVPNDDLPW